MKFFYRCVVLFVVLNFPVTGLKAQAVHSLTVLEEFTHWFTGDFRSIASGIVDTSMRSLSMHHILLDNWKMGDSSIWIYEEIDYTKDEENIYRQLIWELKEQANGTVTAGQYLLTKGWLFNNAWKSNDLMRQLNSDYLTARPFCVLTFDRTIQGMFSGYTQKAGCPNRFKSAVKSTNKSSLTQTQFDYWERGWDAREHQVWGSPKEGIQFARLETLRYPVAKSARQTRRDLEARRLKGFTPDSTNSTKVIAADSGSTVKNSLIHTFNNATAAAKGLEGTVAVTPTSGTVAADSITAVSVSAASVNLVAPAPAVSAAASPALVPAVSASATAPASVSPASVPPASATAPASAPPASVPPASVPPASAKAPAAASPASVPAVSASATAPAAASPASVPPASTPPASASN